MKNSILLFLTIGFTVISVSPINAMQRTNLQDAIWDNHDDEKHNERLIKSLAHRAHEIVLGEALFTTIEARSLSAMSSLLEAGANPNHTSAELLYAGRTPLLFTVSNRIIDENLRIAMAQLLLCKDANPNQYGVFMYKYYRAEITPLISAAESEQKINIVEILLDKKADLNLRDKTDCQHTPLMIAAKSGNYKAVKLLVKRGAQLHLTSTKGKTALDYANKGLQKIKDHGVYSTKNFEAIIELLKKHNK